MCLFQTSDEHGCLMNDKYNVVSVFNHVHDYKETVWFVFKYNYMYGICIRIHVHTCKYINTLSGV